MESITLGQIAIAITFLVGLIGGIEYLKSHVEEWFTKPLKRELEPIKKRIEDVDMNACKNFLVRTLKDMERGVDLSEVELERFYEQYNHYEQCGGNSYIKTKVKQLEEAGVIVMVHPKESEEL